MVAALAADPATPSEEAAPLARRVLDGPFGDRVRRDAASARLWWRRIDALRILARAGDAEAPQRLREALFSGTRPLAGAAASLLGRDGSRRSLEILVEGLVSDVYPSSRLATAIERNGSPSADLLRGRLRDSDPRLRYWAAYLAAGWRDTTGIDADLAALTRDSDPLVRKAALKSLAAVGGPLVRETASRLRDDPIDFVRSQAARVLEAGGS